MRVSLALSLVPSRSPGSRYGSSCNLVLSTGQGVNGYTLDAALGEFILTHPNVRPPLGSSRGSPCGPLGSSPSSRSLCGALTSARRSPFPLVERYTHSTKETRSISTRPFMHTSSQSSILRTESPTARVISVPWLQTYTARCCMVVSSGTLMTRRARVESCDCCMKLSRWHISPSR